MTSSSEHPFAAGISNARAHQPYHVRRTTLPSARQSARLARREVHEALDSWGLGWLEDPAVLLASELVSNAIRHACHRGSEVELRIADTGAKLRIDVYDSDPRLPELQMGPGLEESGLGLVLVEALAARWGATKTGAGKVVWVEVDTGRPGYSGRPPSCNPGLVSGSYSPESMVPRRTRSRQHQGHQAGSDRVHRGSR
jgi:anti-sigma regulatory factor (Ser/Thr protein kinase)